MEIKPYRTKMEYAIYVDENEVLHLAQHIPGTRHGLVPTDVGSELALPRLNAAALHVINVLNKKGVENPDEDSRVSKRQLKGIMVRYSYFEDKSVVYLYVKDEELKLDAGDFFDPELMKGMYVYYSTKKSPAYVQTSLVSWVGEKDLIEELKIDQSKNTLGELNLNSNQANKEASLESAKEVKESSKKYIFPSDGFFQINIPIVEKFLNEAKEELSKLPKDSREVLVDLYAGVGTIGIFVGELFNKVIGVEYFPGSKAYALQNAKNNNIQNYDFFEARSEDANLSSLLTKNALLFLDPPRAGCVQKVIDEILQSQPEYIFYLSCNPETQTRDISLLSGKYKVIHSKDYDFFPNTNHLERFAILKRI